MARFMHKKSLIRELEKLPDGEHTIKVRVRETIAPTFGQALRETFKRNGFDGKVDGPDCYGFVAEITSTRPALVAAVQISGVSAGAIVN